MNGEDLGLSSSDREYCRARATAERSLALAASCERVAVIHEELARLYQGLIDKAWLRPESSMRFGARQNY